MKTATLVKKMTSGFKGDARLYKLSSPILGDEDTTLIHYVIVSAADVLFTGPETYSMLTKMGMC